MHRERTSYSTRQKQRIVGLPRTADQADRRVGQSVYGKVLTRTATCIVTSYRRSVPNGRFGVSTVIMHADPAADQINVAVGASS